MSVSSFWSSFFLPGNKCPRFSFRVGILTRIPSAASLWGSFPFLLLRQLQCGHNVHMKGPAWKYVLLLLQVWELNSLQSSEARGERYPRSFLPPTAALGGRDIHLSWISWRTCSRKAADFPAYQLTNTGTGFPVTGSAWAGRTWCWLGTGEIPTSPAVKAHEFCFMFCGFRKWREISCFSTSFLVQSVEVEDPWLKTAGRLL